MSLELKNVSHVVGAETYLDDISVTLNQGSFNVLLGRTLAGKTTLMRIMAGIEAPTSGSTCSTTQHFNGLSTVH